MYTPYNMFYPELPKAQTGTEVPPVDNKTAPKKDENKVGEIVTSKGKRYKIIGIDPSGKPQVQLLANDDISFLKGDHGDYTKDYELLKETLNDADVKKELWEQYQKNPIKIAPGAAKKGVKAPTINNADDLVSYYLKAEHQIMALNANYDQATLQDKKWDRSKIHSKDAINKIGLDKLTEGDYAVFQNVFKNLARVVANPKSKSLAKLKQFDWTAKGNLDPNSEKFDTEVSSGNVSVEDGWVGNNTNRQINTLAKGTTPPPPPPVEECPPGTTRNPVTGLCEKPTVPPPIIPGTPPPPGEIPEVGWFPQDRNNLYGALADWTGTKKYMPWMAPAKFAHYDPTFYDPSRALANINEQTNMGIQGMNAYSNPQAYVAGYNQMQGKAAEQAANTLGQYENLNVGIANDAAKYNAEVDTKQSLYDAQKTGNYYDQVTIANQQFDNSRSLARKNIIQAYNTGQKNMVDTNNINYMNPYEYYIDSNSGGRIRYNADNAPKTLDASYKDEQTRREDQLANFLTDDRWKGREDILDIYKLLYPSDVYSPSSYEKTRRPKADDDAMKRQALMQQFYGGQ